MGTNELKLNTTFGTALGSGMGALSGNNPFAGAGTSFINSVWTGGNFWDSLGQAGSQIGMQVATTAASTIMNAVGGAITGAISTATEKAKNAKKEKEIASSTASAENEVSNGVNKVENIISEADEKISGYNSDITNLLGVIEEAKELTAKQEEEYKAQITEIQAKIAEFELAQVERNKIKMELDNTDDEDKKKQLQQQYDAATVKIQGLTDGINTISGTINSIRESIAANIELAENTSNEAIAVQAEAVQMAPEVQAALDETSANIQQKVQTRLGEGATAAAQLNQQGTQQIATGQQMATSGGFLNLIPGIGTAVGATNATKGAELIGIGTAGKAGAVTGQAALAGIVTGFGAKFNQPLQNLDILNTNFDNLGVNIDAIMNGSEEFAAYSEKLIEDMDKVTSEYKLPEEATQA